MRLPQSCSQRVSVRAVPCFVSDHLTIGFLTISLALLMVGMAPGSAGAAELQLTCSPASLRFGGLDMGQTEALLVTLTNNGETSVTLSEITASNSEFAASKVSLPLTLAAGESVDLSVSFTPTALGWTGGTMKFSSNASNPTLLVELGGTGVSSESVTASPSILSFGEVEIGANSTLPLVLTNARSWKVTLAGIQSTGGEFSASGGTFPVTLEAGQSVRLDVTFAPQSAGAMGGSLFVYGPALNIPLSGTGEAAQYSVNLWWNSSTDVVGYNVYRSTSASGTYSKINSTLDANTAYTDGSVAAGKTYYYAATSVNSSGQESARSTPPVEAVVP